MNAPIIRLEIDRIKQAILVALPEHTATMDASIQAALEKYCTKENIDLIVQKAATEAIDAAVKEEVRSFFQDSKPGRQAVREAVINHMNQWDKYYARDEAT